MWKKATCGTYTRILLLKWQCIQIIVLTQWLSKEMINFFNWTHKTTDVKKQSFLFVACVRFTSSWHRLHVVSVLFPVVWAAVVKDIVTVFTAVLFAAKLHTCVIRFKANRTGVAAGAGVGAVVGAGTGEGESCRRHSLHYHHRQHKDRLLQ